MFLSRFVLGCSGFFLGSFEFSLSLLQLEAQLLDISLVIDIFVLYFQQLLG
jgi:hypothetical protein